MRAVLRWSRKGGVVRRYLPWVLLWAILVGLPLLVFGGEMTLRLVGGAMVVVGVFGWCALGWIRTRLPRFQWTEDITQPTDPRCLICHLPFQLEGGYAAVYLSVEDPEDEEVVQIIDHVPIAASGHLGCLPALWHRLSSMNPEQDASYLPSMEEFCATLARVQR